MKYVPIFFLSMAAIIYAAMLIESPRRLASADEYSYSHEVDEAALRERCNHYGVTCAVKQESDDMWMASGYLTTQRDGFERDWWFAHTRTRASAMGKLYDLLAGAPTNPGYRDEYKIN